MKIDKSNIEVYLLDYLDGNLDPMLTAELMAFIAENPGYEKWLPGFDGLLCAADGLSFENKPLLKKDFGNIPEIIPENFDEFCIASMEGLLQDDDIARLNEYLSRHPEKQKDYQIYRQLKLKPDMSLVYSGKTGLRKPIRHILPVRYIYYAFATAASLALLLMLTSRKPPVQKYSVTIPENTLGRPQNSPAGPAKTIEAPAPPVMHTLKSSALAANPVKAGTGSYEKVKNSSDLPELTAILPRMESQMASVQQAPELQRYLLSGNVSLARRNAKAYSSSDNDPSALKYLASALKKLNFWKAAESAIVGFNYLTESDISISKTTDQNGKLTSLALNTEQFTISGTKVK